MKRTFLAAASVATLALLAACGNGDDAQTDVAAAEDAAPAGGAPAPAADIAIPDNTNPLAFNLAQSQQFLADNAERPEVTLTTSGLQYEVVESGPADGASPTEADWVCVDYTGMLPDGTVFDSTSGGSPLALPLNGIIDGWREALPLMATGDKWRLFIPPELGYGANGAGGAIPPNAALVFDIALLRVMTQNEIAVLPDQRVDPSWNCLEEPAPVAPADR